MRLTVRATTRVAPEHVYGVLADLDGHRSWAGDSQLPLMRLVEVTAAQGSPAAEGHTWSSRGQIPLHSQHWEDSSRVTVASPSRCFEYITDARIPRSRGRTPREGTYRHRYEIEPDGRGGSRVSYTLNEEHFRHPLLRLAIPGLRRVTWATGVRVMAGRGLANVLRMAGERSALTTG